MATNTLSVIIDERKNLEQIDSAELLQQASHYSRLSASQCQVFKNYLMSSEVFYVDTELK